MRTCQAAIGRSGGSPVAISRQQSTSTAAALGSAPCGFTRGWTSFDGNVTQRSCPGETLTFTWSAEGRLTGMTVAGQTLAFQYDAGGRLIRKDVAGVPQRHFVWDGLSLLAELDGAGTAKQAEYSYYQGLDNPHAVIVGSTQYFAHTDGLGNVIGLTDTARVVQRTYGYGPWGALSGGMDYGGFAGKDRARFKGALWLGPEAELYYMRNRWYEPKTGRFLSEDPIGLAGGINLYTFAADDPVNEADPLGLNHEEDEETPCGTDAVVGIIPGAYNGASGDYYTCTSADGSTYQVFVRYSDGGSPNSITVSASPANPNPSSPPGQPSNRLFGAFFGFDAAWGFVGLSGGLGAYVSDGGGGVFASLGPAQGIAGSLNAMVLTSSNISALRGWSNGGCLGGGPAGGCTLSNPSGTTHFGGLSVGMPFEAIFLESYTWATNPLLIQPPPYR